jgi:hypothetical protein
MNTPSLAPIQPLFSEELLTGVAAYSVAAWLRRADLNGSLPHFFNPHLELPEREIAKVEVGLWDWSSYAISWQYILDLEMPRIWAVINRIVIGL